ncbi:hypothetical protein AU14_12770 [Marinobacter similis]|uniref:Uncharacterized protein n=1 Tax=Marinobacter similis TaxID=1420916 RepID=W5YM15_9GAMM|nr:hypothetical protein AU14_12770 [Marinobacter similis]
MMLPEILEGALETGFARDCWLIEWVLGSIRSLLGPACAPVAGWNWIVNTTKYGPGLIRLGAIQHVGKSDLIRFVSGISLPLGEIRVVYGDEDAKEALKGVFNAVSTET